MKHKGLKTFAGFIIVLAAAFIVLSFTIDGIVKSAIEEDGRELFQTAVEVSNVNISMWNGTSEIYGFTVSNPDQFSDQPAIELDEIQLKIDLASMLSDTILIENIRITGVRLLFEQQGFGINLRSLNQNMDLSADEDDAVVVIENLLVENATVQVSSTIDRERTVEANIENIELEGIGRDGNNTLKQSMQQILEPLIERAIQEAVTGGLLQQLENRFKELLGGDEN
ncbi:DUF748 domain-containing protein [Rhodohalobacter sulfatireducens]|uniref:AsmA family protein n=1 Tax=Rhodohalobacter sulfatireducens TaxID=2911366 RepID=A0ABS9K834_9BACT|nr:hypothetical protein [Rhodohalobacter sulfatireducens]MCG2587007.1 hypothetical protein [Rhodohalobacter sulfatireducens]MDR9363960.1 hypothetical protein [Balneolaceae bacterium]MDR9407954.1 hypothetical protein [Balneolaceae bacterium]